jgi:O-acetyl-ADP-ribose deacetylase (regulator of RNase III)
MRVCVEKTNITSIHVDAIVNPANSLGVMGSGIPGVLRQQGGEVIQAEAMSAAPIAVGAAVVTRAGALPAKHIIHAPTMDEPGAKIGAEHVRRAARAALLAAAARQFQAVAFPTMGTDVEGIDMAEAARAVVEEIRAHKRSFPETVYLVDPSEEAIEAFETALYNAQFGL